MTNPFGTTCDGAFVRSWKLRGSGPPPWLLFSARWPWVSTPAVSTGVVNGSCAIGLEDAIHTTMIPLDSNQVAWVESYVAVMESLSPFFTDTAQSDGVAVIATSHDTLPIGS